MISAGEESQRMFFFSFIHLFDLYNCQFHFYVTLDSHAATGHYPANLPQSWQVSSILCPGSQAQAQNQVSRP